MHKMLVVKVTQCSAFFSYNDFRYCFIKNYLLHIQKARIKLSFGKECKIKSYQHCKYEKMNKFLSLLKYVRFYLFFNLTPIK